MNPGLDFYHVCNAFSLHYNEKADYDCMKYNFKTKSNLVGFNKSNLKWQFIGVERNLVGYDTRFIMYMVYSLNESSYIPIKNALRMALTVPKTQKDFLEKIFKKDLLYLKKEYSDPQNIFMIDGLYPNIYKEYKNRKININTLSLLSTFIVDTLKTENSKDVIAWPSFIKKIERDKQLIKYFFDHDDISHYFSEYLLT